MPKIFTALDKIRPAYDVAYKAFLLICKLLLVADILITTYAVLARWCQNWAKEYPDVLGFLYVLHGGAGRCPGHPPGRPHPHDRL